MSALSQILGYVGPAGALGIVLTWLFIKSQREERKAEREHRLEMERRRTTDIEQIVAGWESTSSAMIKVCDETRAAVLGCHESVKTAVSAIATDSQNNQREHELIRESIRDLVSEQRLRNAQHTPVHSPAYRDE